MITYTNRMDKSVKNSKGIWLVPMWVGGMKKEEISLFTACMGTRLSEGQLKYYRSDSETRHSMHSSLFVELKNVSMFLNS